jgi:hypothetical protein
VADTGAPGWTDLGFDDSGWTDAFDEGPYDTIPWTRFAPPLSQFSSSGARWIWRGSPPYYPGYGYYDDGSYTDCFFRKVINFNVGGNDVIDRPVVDDYINFTILDRNHPIGTDGTLRAWEIYARDDLGLPFDPLQLVIFRQTGPITFAIIGTSELRTPTQVGINTFPLASFIAVRAGDLVGLRYTGKASVPFEYDPPSFSARRGDFEGTMLFSTYDSGLTNTFETSSDRTYSIRVR